MSSARSVLPLDGAPGPTCDDECHRATFYALWPVVAGVLSIVWFTAAAGGGLAAIGATFVTRRRRPFLIAAAACFWVAGLLGLASIGILFLGAAASCLVALSRGGPDHAATAELH